ncbi:MAG: DUF5666 domain-containing protein [Pyrinomonadaceae bacterium]|nr:DUF5666 domain-containing protein [Pyrinomonadaceae bacterium]
MAQTPSTVKPSVVTGDVTSVTESAIKLKTASGDLAIEVAANTEFKRVPADNPKLSAAVPVERTAIANGDKLVISGFYAADMSKLAARTVYLMAKSDIDEKKAKEAARWSTRGMSGKVTAVDAAAKKITVEVRGLMGTTTLTVNPTDSTVYKRYAPGSVKYSESIAGSLANIQVGDMLRAVGDRSADGTAFTAEEILTGSFETIAGTVKSVDAANNQVTITNLQTQKDVIVDLKTASLMKRFPEEMAMRLAAFQGGGPNGGARPGGGQPQAGGQPAAGGQPGGAPGQGQQRPGGGMGGGPRGGIDEMLERFPSISVADLKPGDMIAVSSSKDHSDDRLTAIKVLAGVEPFIRAAQASGAMQRGGRGMGQGAFTIPGLDGVDFQ